MKKCKGRPYNFANEVIGKITHSPISRLFRSDYVLITHNPTGKEFGYRGVLTSKIWSDFSNLNNTKSVFYSEINNLEMLHDGDIVLLKQNGDVVILFEKLSGDNSLLLTEQCNCSCLMCPQAITKKMYI